jgi:hypothetical protein
MRTLLLFVLILGSSALSVLVFFFSTGIELPKNIKSTATLDFIVLDKFAVIQGYVWQDIIDLLLAIVDVHIFCAHFIFLVFVADNPIASSGKKSDLFCYLGEDLTVNDNCPLANLFFAVDLGL